MLQQLLSVLTATESNQCTCQEQNHRRGRRWQRHQRTRRRQSDSNTQTETAAKTDAARVAGHHQHQRRHLPAKMPATSPSNLQATATPAAGPMLGIHSSSKQAEDHVASSGNFSDFGTRSGTNIISAAAVTATNMRCMAVLRDGFHKSSACHIS